jgi:DNA-binding NarL/FixJ family response regulator
MVIQVHVEQALRARIAGAKRPTTPSGTDLTSMAAHPERSTSGILDEAVSQEPVATTSYHGPTKNEDVAQARAEARTSWKRSVWSLLRYVRALNSAAAERQGTGPPARVTEPISGEPIEIGALARVRRERIEAQTAEVAPEQAPFAPEHEGNPSRLTRRQREVATLIAQGYTDKQIAQELVLTAGTASNHVSHIMRRLECHSRAQVATWAVQNGLLGLPLRVTARH